MAQAARRVETSEHGYSGRLLLRMPPDLHAAVAKQAEEASVSLNQLITGAVAASVGWAAPDAPPKRQQRRTAVVPRALAFALAVNVAVVLVAGAAAIALLIAAR